MKRMTDFRNQAKFFSSEESEGKRDWEFIYIKKKNQYFPAPLLVKPQPFKILLTRAPYKQSRPWEAGVDYQL